MKKIGVVEGYYGKSSNFDDRKKIIESLNSHDLNFYLYAPKEDPFLRSHIDIEYTKEWLTAFCDFVDFSKDHSVNVGVGLAPVKTADTADLKEKIKVPDLTESAVYKLRKHVEQIDDGSEEDEEVGDDFESLYKGEISKSGTPILPSKRARKTPEKIQVSKEDLAELSETSKPEIDTQIDEENTNDQKEVSLEEVVESEDQLTEEGSEESEPSNS